MDTITHGIAGALIGKAVFRGGDMFGSHPMNRGRIITWSLMFGAIFPDFDVLRDIFSHDRLLVITWHRSITHSLVLLPLWAVLLAGITRAIASSRKSEAARRRDVARVHARPISDRQNWPSRGRADFGSRRTELHRHFRRALPLARTPGLGSEDSSRQVESCGFRCRADLRGVYGLRPSCRPRARAKVR